VLGPATALDGQYTVFARVAEGLDVLARIETAALDGETPVDRIEVTAVRLVRTD
jgi:cyclophilin family peptidyl-prolyl cis-trans isomerase